jgi:hypothetical protein
LGLCGAPATGKKPFLGMALRDLCRFTNEGCCRAAMHRARERGGCRQVSRKIRRFGGFWRGLIEWTSLRGDLRNKVKERCFRRAQRGTAGRSRRRARDRTQAFRPSSERPSAGRSPWRAAAPAPPVTDIPGGKGAAAGGCSRQPEENFRNGEGVRSWRWRPALRPGARSARGRVNRRRNRALPARRKRRRLDRRRARRKFRL